MFLYNFNHTIPPYAFTEHVIKRSYSEEEPGVQSPNQKCPRLSPFPGSSTIYEAESSVVRHGLFFS
jgi:hypothetical protein